jgi:hypothetical protein|tara:strand:+ start:422 stop:700 length:279 start_codon:yes stop_codon:yes gene_type:complete
MLRNSINLGQSIWRDMMVLNKSAVRKLFNKDGVQVNVLALNYIDDWVHRAVLEMVGNAQSQNLKRIKPKNIKSVCPNLVRELVLMWEPTEDA